MTGPSKSAMEEARPTYYICGICHIATPNVFNNPGDHTHMGAPKDLWSPAFSETAIARAIDEAVLDENEACAKIARERQSPYHQAIYQTGEEIAAAILARGGEK